MSLNKYYKTLGLLPGADQAAIRKAFRKLAMRYHPDKNPTPSAQAKFIAITEAYEILSGKKPAPTTRVSRSKSTARRKPTNAGPSTTEKSDAERVREAKERQEEQEIRERIENERFFKHLTSGWRWKIMRVSAIIGVIISIALITERFLPSHFEPDEVTAVSIQPGFYAGSESLSIIETKANTSYWISRISYDLYGRHTRFYVRSSWLFHEPKELWSIGKVGYRLYPVHFSFYSNFILIILFFLLPCATLLAKSRTIYFTFIHYLSLYGVNVVMLYFLLRNDHWAHLLTLGFF
ncbi:MAG: J domain-containing protein [Crocinitomicaceae bacterium]